MLQNLFSRVSQLLFPQGWQAAVLSPLLRIFIRHGTLIVQLPKGPELNFGDCADPRVSVRVHDTRAIFALILNPDLALGELYMDGRLTVEDGGDITDLLDLVFANVAENRFPPVWTVLRSLHLAIASIGPTNSAPRSRKNAAHHYDLSENLYALFLDDDLQYSCAYFSSPSESLDAAQLAKKRHIISKLLLDKPNLSILDIGSGWGGMALDLAHDFEANVRGVTLSEEQLVKSRKRAEEAGLKDRCQFELTDYRSLMGRYDRIVSVGMFEHVGRRNYRHFFNKVRELLDDEGVMLLHTIGRLDGPGTTSPWIDKYIFPGGHIPSLSEITRVIERSRLLVVDVEVLRLHYAKTLMEWRKRFDAHRAEIAKLYDERFCRMWEFYLAGSEMSFRHLQHVVFQIQIAKRIDALPLTRDYIVDLERAISATIDHDRAPDEPQPSKTSPERQVA